MIVGLCGGSGSGKGAVTNFFSELGAFVIDTDKIYHNITSYMSPCLKALVDIFGDSIVNSDGSLNRRALSDLVFNGADSDYKRHMLNSVSHKFVLSEVRNIISQNSDNKKNVFVVDAPLLFESGFDKECDFIVAVVADEKVRVSRIVNRDGISEDRAKARIKSQIQDSKLKEKSDFVITNNGTLDELKSKVVKTAKKLFI